MLAFVTSPAAPTPEAKMSGLEVFADLLPAPLRPALLEPHAFVVCVTVHVPTCAKLAHSSFMQTVRPDARLVLLLRDHDMCNCVADLLGLSVDAFEELYRLLRTVGQAVPVLEEASLFEAAVFASSQQFGVSALSLGASHPGVVEAVEAFTAMLEARADAHVREHGHLVLDLLMTVAEDEHRVPPRELVHVVKALCPGMSGDPERVELAKFRSAHERRLRRDGALTAELERSLLLTVREPLQGTGSMVLLKALKRVAPAVFGRADGSLLVPAVMAHSPMLRASGQVRVPSGTSDEVLDTVTVLVRGGTDPEAALQIATDLAA